MKQSRFFPLTIILILALFVTVLVGCQDEKAEEQTEGMQHEKFYGTVRWLEDFHQLVIYIPGVGDVAIPQSEKCIAGFDGYEENEDTAYELKAGDLVAINFAYEKDQNEYGVSIMETYPAQFGMKATLIEALKENVFFTKTESGYEFSFALADTESTFAAGDDIYIVYHSGKDGFDSTQLLASGTVTEISDGMATAGLGVIENEKDFLEKLLSSTMEKEWSK